MDNRTYVRDIIFKSFLAIILGVALVFTAVTPSESAVKRVIITQAVESLAFVSNYVARANGYFAEEGLAAEGHLHAGRRAGHQGQPRGQSGFLHRGGHLPDQRRQGGRRPHRGDELPEPQHRQLRHPQGRRQEARASPPRRPTRKRSRSSRASPWAPRGPARSPTTRVNTGSARPATRPERGEAHRRGRGPGAHRGASAR